MVGTSEVSKKPTATPKDVLIDFLAGGTGLCFIFIDSMKLLNFSSSCMYIQSSFIFHLCNVHFIDF
jgi:hypothetical protein